MKTVTVNLNDVCRVELTEEGLERLRQSREESLLRLPFPARERLRKAFEPLTGKESFQLWELFSVFGPMLCAGSSMPFKDGFIKVRTSGSDD